MARIKRPAHLRTLNRTRRALADLVRNGAVALACSGFAGCLPNTRWYEPVSPRKIETPSAELDAKQVLRNPRRTVVTAEIEKSSPDTAFGRPRLTSPDGAACASGRAADSWASSMSDDPARTKLAPRGNVAAVFTNANTDREGLLLVRPTVLDVPLATFSAESPAASSCLRLPLLVSGDGAFEWRQDPKWWLGIEVRIEVPVHRLAGIGATTLFPVSAGFLAGPVRLGLELGAGFGFGPRDAQRSTEGAGIFEVGARVDSPLLVIHRFATGLELGYELEGWSLGTDLSTNQSVTATVHGPRAALRFLLVPPPPPSSKYEARPDAWSAGIQVSGSLLYVVGVAAPTTAIGGSVFGDIGW